MKRSYERWFARLEALLARARWAAQGRPLALAMLLGLSLINLSSEWPGDLPQPAFAAAVDATLPESFKAARQLLFDQYQRRYPRIPATQPVTVVDIDEETLATVGQWPWPRNRLADLINAIAALKPLAIGLDIYMPEPDQTSPDKVAANLPKTAADLAAGLRALPSHEAILAQSLHDAPSILGAAALDHDTFAASTDLRSAPILVHGSDPLEHVQRFDYVLASLPELQEAAHGQAMLSVSLEQGVVRHIPLIMGLRNKLVPSLPMEMLRLATDSAAIDVYSDRSGVQAVGVADVQVPTQPDGDIWLHFASIRSTLNRYVSARDVLQGTVDPNRIRGKLILVGLTGTGVTDMRTTPLGELVPGIEIQAQTIEAIVDGRFLRRPPWLKWAESAFILLVGLLIIWYMPRTNSRIAVFMKTVPKATALVGLLLNLLNAVCCFLIFVRFGLLVDAASIFIILSAVMGCFFSRTLLLAAEESKTAATQVQAQAQIQTQPQAQTQPSADANDRTGNAP